MTLQAKDLTVTPALLDMGVVPSNVEVCDSLVITNNRSVDVVLRGVEVRPDDYEAKATLRTTVIPAGSSVVVDVCVRTVSFFQETDTVVVLVENEEPLRAVVTYRSEPGIIVADDITFDYRPGSTIVLTARLKNTGTPFVRIYGVRFAELTSVFNLLSPPSVPFDLKGGEELMIRVQFTADKELTADVYNELRWSTSARWGDSVTVINGRRVTSVEEENADDVAISPQPLSRSSGEVLEVTIERDATVILYDMQGRRLFAKDVHAGSMEFSPHTFPTVGLYILVFQTNSGARIVPVTIAP
jgi:hypothetical protein